MSAPSILTVDSNATPATGGWGVTVFDTIQSAVDAAGENDTIRITDGVYNENVLISTNGLTIQSVNGRGATTVIGSDGSPRQGTFELASGTNGVTIDGLTVEGVNGNGASEKGAIYIQGANDGFTLINSEIVAKGDAGLMSEYAGAVTNAVIDGNVFSGTTFEGAQPEGPGGPNTQFTAGNNFARQLVVLGNGGGAGDSISNNVTFTNNQVIGTAGGISSVSGLPYGNTLVTIDVSNSTISGNTFTGFTVGWASALRARRDGIDIENNLFDQSTGGQFAFPASIYMPYNTTGSVANNHFINSAGIEVFTGTPGDDMIAGTAGDDLFIASAGADHIDGLGGNDTYDISGAGSGGAYVDLQTGAGFSTLTGLDMLSSIENVHGSAGDDGLFGSAGDNIFFASDGNDTIDGRDGVDTYDASDATTDIAVDLAAGTVSGAYNGSVANIENVKTGGGNDEVTGTSGDNEISTGAGDDVIQGGAGADTIDGGAGVDTAVYSDAATIDVVDGGWVVTSAADGDDTLANVEVVDDMGAGGARTFLVGHGGLATIEDALALAGDGDTILVGEGTYSGLFTITQNNLTIKGVGDPANIVIEGAGTGRGISVGADGVTLENLSVGNFLYGIEVENGSDGLTITGVHISDSTVGVRKATNSVVNDLTIEGGSMTNLDFGVYMAKHATTGRLDGLTIDGTDFSDIAKRGIYLETGDNVDVSNITMDTVGVDYIKGAGISINLLYDEGTPYSNISIDGFTFTNVGNGGDDRAAINVKAQDSGGYASNPASVSDVVTISNGTIDGTTVGIRAGEPGHSGPEVSISHVDVDNASVADADNVTGSTMTVTLADGGDAWSMAPTTTGSVEITGGNGADLIGGGGGDDVLIGGDGDDLINGGAGDDVIQGGSGADTIDGGAGVDTAVYSDAATIDVVDGGWVVTSAADGEDTLSNVEAVDDMGAGGARTFLVGHGGLATIQEALALAGDGDTILVGEGTYSGVFTVTQNDLTIKGVGDPANIVIEGNYATEGGSLKAITLAADNTTIENLSINNFYGGIELGNGVDGATVRDVDISNGVLGVRKGTAAVVNDLTIEGGSMSGLQQGVVLFMDSNGVGRVDGLTIDGTDFSAIGHKGIYLETGSNVSIANITMDDVGQDVGNGAGIDINLKYSNGVPYTGITIDGFVFTDVGADGLSGTAIGIKARDDGSYSGNPALFDGVVQVLNGTIDGTSTGIRVGEPGKFIAGPAVDVTNVNVTNATEAEGDNVTGSTMTITLSDNDDVWAMASTTTGRVVISGEAGNDDITGGAGNDTLIGGDGDDTLSGGAGADALQGGVGRDTASYIASLAGVNVDLSVGTALGGDAQGDTLSLIENIIGSNHDDVLVGNDEDNILRGELGNDLLIGGAGNDTLIGGAGADAIQGGAGIDTASYEGSGAGVSINLATGVMAGGDAEGDTLSLIENIIGSDHADTITGNSDDNVLAGGRGADTLSGGAGNDTLLGEAGRDQIHGGDGDDVIRGGNANDKLRGDGGNDTIFGGNGKDVIFGGTGDDILLGGNGKDRIFGGGGNDSINGGAGNDVMNGGNGADVFIFNTGDRHDRITDFSANQGDVIDFSGHRSINSFGDLLANLSDVDGNAVITAGSDSLVLEGVSAADIGVGLTYTADDFIF